MCPGLLRPFNKQGRMEEQRSKISPLLLLLILLENCFDAFAFNSFSKQHYCHHRGTTISYLSINDLHDHASTMTKTSVTRPFELKRIDHIVIRCHDFPAMFDFYTRILGCTIDEPTNDHVNRFGGALTHLRAGSCYIDLLAYDMQHLTEEGKQFAARSYAGGAGIGENSTVEELQFLAESSTLDHVCIRIEPFDEKSIKEYLLEQSVTIVAAGEGRLGADGVGPSIYVRDPEGNVIELKGKPVSATASGDNEQISAQAKYNDNTSPGTDMSDCPVADKERNNGGERSSADASTNSHQTKSTPITPCNRICRYNNSFYNGQVCIGCFREEYEIKMWQSMTASEKSLTLLDQIDRCIDVEKSNGVTYDGAVTVEELKRQYGYWSAIAKNS